MFKLFQWSSIFDKKYLWINEKKEEIIDEKHNSRKNDWIKSSNVLTNIQFK